MPLSLLLKTQTQPQHDDAEHHPLHAVLFGSQGHARARAAYVRLLAQHLHVQEAFEPRLRSAASGSRLLGALVREHHYHLDALREDLAALGVTPELRIMCPATTRFIAFIELCAAHEGHGLLGVFYVFEGSTNGGTIVAKKIKESLGTGDGAGTRFINPHGPLVRARWAAWKEMLDTIDFDARQRHAIIAAARETFRLSHAVLDDVHRAMHPDGVTHTPIAVAP